jgi:PAS domain S-box-containing protein
MSERGLQSPGSTGDQPANKLPKASGVADWMFLQPSILDQMHDAVIVVDLQGVVTGCNRAVADMYGYTPEELTGQNVAVLYTEEDLPLLRDTILPAVLETGEYRGEVRILTRTGERPYIHLSVALLRDGDGKPVGMVGFSVNVTAQKLGDLAMQRAGEVERERDALQASSAHMQLLFNAVENAEDVVLITEAEPKDLPGPRIVYANKSFERMTGYSRAEVVGKTPRILQGVKSDRAALDRIGAALKTWTPVRERLINYRKDGVEFVTDLSIFPVADEKGWYTHWIAIQRDITEAYAIEQRLRESEESYRVLAEAIPQLVWTASGNGKKLFCNRKYLEYTGAQSLEELDTLWVKYVHPDDQARAQATWERAKASGEQYSCEYRLRRKDGVYRHFLARAEPLRSAEGVVERWLGASTDIEEQKQTEAALRHTEKLAAAGRLAASLAHEINNPLSAAINSIYIVMLDTALSEGNRAYLQQAEAELARVAHVTTQTLGFFRQSTPPMLADVGAVMTSALSLFSGRFEAHSIGKVKLYRARADVFCCRDEMQQVFVNLISNSLDAVGARGRVTVHVAGGRLWNAERTPGVRVTIADNGVGIPVQLQEKIFDAFMSTKEATGTGLGLWVVQNLVKKHEGKIKLRSSTGARRHGTVISIFLPYENGLR